VVVVVVVVAAALLLTPDTITNGSMVMIPLMGFGTLPILVIVKLMYLLMRLMPTISL
jgi:hypothetical protein